MDFNNTTTTLAPARPNILIEPFSNDIKILFYACYCFIFIVGVIGNGIVIYVIGFKYKIRRSFDVHILSLATADFITAISIPVTGFHDTFHSYQIWTLFGDVGCKIFPSVNHLTQIVSSTMLIVISINRLQVIRSELTITCNIRRAVSESACTWLISILATVPYTYHLTYAFGTCYENWSAIASFTYFTVYISLTSFVPIFLMCLTYTISIVKLYRFDVPGDDKRYLVKRIKQNRKIVKMFGSIVLLYFTITTPYMTSYLISSIYSIFAFHTYVRNLKVFYYTIMVTYTIASFNCCVNPFAYATMHNNMKKTVSTIRRSVRLSHRNSNVSSSPSTNTDSTHSCKRNNNRLRSLRTNVSTSSSNYTSSPIARRSDLYRVKPRLTRHNQSLDN